MKPHAAVLTSLLLLVALTAADCRTATKKSAAKPGEVKTAAPSSPEALRLAIEKVGPLHKKMGPPQPGDWLDTFPEPGQTFEEYLRGNPTRPEGARRVLYVQPLGRFTPAQSRVVELAADFMSRFFGLTVRVRDPAQLDRVPLSARRVSVWGDKQIQSGYIMMDVLRPTLPPDAAALIAFTSSDLFPDETLNFVFGQASLGERVGVWSLYRLGRPDASEAAFKLTLLRTLKIAAHETGHMFSVRHCTKYECVMNGTNHLAESDRHPLDACPECMAKLCWAAGADPRERYARLAEFCAEHGLEDERRFFEASRRALEKN